MVPHQTLTLSSSQTHRAEKSHLDRVIWTSCDKQVPNICWPLSQISTSLGSELGESEPHYWVNTKENLGTFDIMILSIHLPYTPDHPRPMGLNALFNELCPITETSSSPHSLPREQIILSGSQ